VAFFLWRVCSRFSLWRILTIGHFDAVQVNQ
jgi:hypothetical protein